MESSSTADFEESMSRTNEVNAPARRKPTSVVWNSFEKITKPNGKVVAVCNHCGSNFVGDNGTSNLRNHLKRKHKELVTVSDSSLSANTYEFNQEKSRKDLSTMVIKHNYPLSIVDHKYFRIYSHGLNPDFIIHTRNTIRSDITSIYKEEKEKMYTFLESVSSKVTLTTDIWTSDHQNLAYICLTAHFIDENWELQNKILAYRHIVYPHDGDTLFKFIRDLVLEWNIDKKLFAMVVDNASSNDVMVRKLKSWLLERSLLSLKGDLFHVRCSAHILNLVVQVGLKVIQGLLDKIRLTIRCLRNSTYAKQKFDFVANQVKLNGPKILPIDVPHRWNSTYLMLDVAISMRKALERLVDHDKNYHHNPSREEWEVAGTIKKCLEGFYNATKHFSGRNFPTSNVFFPDICDLQFNLSNWEKSNLDFLRALAGPMKEKFVKYWDDCSLVLALALGIVFDPRFKLKMVEYYYTKLYGEEEGEPYVSRVKVALWRLYLQYKTNVDDETEEGETNVSSVMVNDKYSDFDKWCEKEDPRGGEQQKSEVDTYLDDPLFPRANDFSVLQWWKINATKYQIIAKMARDVLAVPATTVASESAFSVGGRIIDETRSSMHPELVEALVTTNGWME